MELEDELRRALEPVSPPAGFDQRVLSRIVAGEVRSREPERRSRQRWFQALAAVAAVFVMATAGGLYYEHRLERVEAQRAASDVREALAIASEKLAAVQQRVNGPRRRF